MMTLTDSHLAPVQLSDPILHHSLVAHEVQTQQPSFYSLTIPSPSPHQGLAFAALCLQCCALDLCKDSSCFQSASILNITKLASTHCINLPELLSQSTTDGVA